jgi:pantoate kinase
MLQKQQAFAPGHISGFFEPVIDKENIDRTGSRGSGLSISSGATSTVKIKPSTSQKIITRINQTPTRMPVTILAVKKLVANQPIHIDINTQVTLPPGQGFGMSAAGALSTTLALAHLLEKPFESALSAAHFAEVSLQTGLGDVIGSSFGGIEIRKKAGLPPWGLIEHIPGAYPVVLCIIDKKISTQSILTNPSHMKKIQKYGNLCTNKILENPSMENMFTLAKWFAIQTGLISPNIQSALESIKNHANASQCMLGNSIFAIGDTEKIVQKLSNFGEVFISSVDKQGARLV